MEELEKQILLIVNKKHLDTGGNNGNNFADFEHLFKTTIYESNVFLSNMVSKKLIVFREGFNTRLIMLPKK